MSADTRIWNRLAWDRYHKAQHSHISKVFLAGEMTVVSMYEERERIYQEFCVYVRARMAMYKNGQVPELEF